MTGMTDFGFVDYFATNWQQTKRHISLYFNVVLIDLSV